MTVAVSHGSFERDGSGVTARRCQQEDLRPTRFTAGQARGLSAPRSLSVESRPSEDLSGVDRHQAMSSRSGACRNGWERGGFAAPAGVDSWGLSIGGTAATGAPTQSEYGRGSRPLAKSESSASSSGREASSGLRRSSSISPGRWPVSEAIASMHRFSCRQACQPQSSQNGGGALMTSSTPPASCRAVLTKDANVSQVRPKVSHGDSAVCGAVDGDGEIGRASFLPALDPAHAPLGRKPYTPCHGLQGDLLIATPSSKLHSAHCSNKWNTESNEYVPKNGADGTRRNTHYSGMESDWHITEWLTYAQKRQADLVNDLGWSRRKASDVCNGVQPYKRDIVNEVAVWLGVEPYELLMSPDEAIRLRHIRQAMLAIAEQPSPLKDLKD